MRLALLALAWGLGAARAFTWKECRDLRTSGTVKDVSLHPDPPSPGSTAVFSVDATTDVAIESGTLQIGVSYNNFPIYTETKDLCDSIACPVESGPVELRLKEPFPAITPPGPYSVRLSAFGPDTEARQLLCLDVNFQVVPQGAAAAQ